jgi:DNA-binding SARP family transcriptional activator
LGLGPALSTAPGSAELRVSLLNGLQLWRDQEVVTLPMGAQRLLAFVALHDRPVLRLHVAGTLWPDAPEDRSNGSLRSALWRLRQPGCQLVLATPQYLQLAAAVTVDFREATAAARHLLAGPAEEELAFSAQLAEPRDLLTGWYEEWVLLERERFRQLRLHALETLCDQLTAAGRFGEAIQAGLTAAAGEPLRESAHRSLIRAHLAEGNWCEAVRRYRSYAKLLHEELGLKPSAAMNDLVKGLGVC